MKFQIPPQLTRDIARILLKISNIYMQKLTLKEIEQLSVFLGNLGYLFAVSPRKIIRDNLALALPELDTRRRNEIAKQFFYQFIAGAFELLHFLSNPERIDTHISIQGLEHLDEVLSEGKGVVAVTAHFGNFPLMMAKLARDGYDVSVLARPLRDEKSGDYIHRLRSNAGVKTIFSLPRRECISNTIRTLRENKIVFMLVDQNFGSDGAVWIEFFGHLASTPTGATVFALRTQAAILPMFIVREPLGRYTIHIEKKVERKRFENQQEELLMNTVFYSKIIESWIRRYPGHWGWIHKRWKSRPTPAVLTQPFRVYPQA